MSDERMNSPAEGGTGSGAAEHSATLTTPGDDAPGEKTLRRALLVLNPKATMASGRTSEVLVGALSSVFGLRAVRTERRGHAAELARSAMDEGADVVIAFGGDGNGQRGRQRSADRRTR